MKKNHISSVSDIFLCLMGFSHSAEPGWPVIQCQQQQVFLIKGWKFLTHDLHDLTVFSGYSMYIQGDSDDRQSDLQLMVFLTSFPMLLCYQLTTFTRVNIWVQYELLFFMLWEIMWSWLSHLSELIICPSTEEMKHPYSHCFAGTQVWTDLLCLF